MHFKTPKRVLAIALLLLTTNVAVTNQNDQSSSLQQQTADYISNLQNFINSSGGSKGTGSQSNQGSTSQGSTSGESSSGSSSEASGSGSGSGTSSTSTDNSGTSSGSSSGSSEGSSGSGTSGSQGGNDISSGTGSENGSGTTSSSGASSSASDGTTSSSNEETNTDTGTNTSSSESESESTPGGSSGSSSGSNSGSGTSNEGTGQQTSGEDTENESEGGTTTGETDTDEGDTEGEEGSSGSEEGTSGSGEGTSGTGTSTGGDVPTGTDEEDGSSSGSSTGSSSGTSGSSSTGSDDTSSGSSGSSSGSSGSSTGSTDVDQESESSSGSGSSNTGSGQTTSGESSSENEGEGTSTEEGSTNEGEQQQEITSLEDLQDLFPTVSSGNQQSSLLDKLPDGYVITIAKSNPSVTIAQEEEANPSVQTSFNITFTGGFFGNSDDDEDGTTTGAVNEEDEEEDEAVCGYLSNGSIDYSLGGDNWCGQCQNSTYQQSPIEVPRLYTFSPIRFNMDVNISLADVRRYWIDQAKDFLTVNYRCDGFMRVDGVLPDQKEVSKFMKPDGKIVFHSPAEHKFERSGQYDVEMQVGFHSILGEQGFISVFFNRTTSDRDNSFISGLKLDALNETQANPWVFEDIGLNKLVNGLDQLSLWYYEGSLTQPPCTGGVQWFLFDDPQPISEEQLEVLQGFFANNSREAQPVLNDFEIWRLSNFNVETEGCGPCSSWWL